MLLSQVDDTEIINFLLTTEIIPLCLKTMEMGSELSKTVATFIVQKILLDNVRPFYLGHVTATQMGHCNLNYRMSQPFHCTSSVRRARGSILRLLKALVESSQPVWRLS